MRTVEEASNAMALDGIIYEVVICSNAIVLLNVLVHFSKAFSEPYSIYYLMVVLPYSKGKFNILYQIII